jgi:hypothetical protein
MVAGPTRYRVAVFPKSSNFFSALVSHIGILSSTSAIRPTLAFPREGTYLWCSGDAEALLKLAAGCADRQ